MFNFLLEGEATGGYSSLITIGGIVLLVVVFYFFMIRPQRKQEKKDAEMRNALMVTTIGGIIGKVVSIKEETFVLETTKDRTKIRFLKGAIRTVDVRVADIAKEQAQEKAAEKDDFNYDEPKAEVKEDAPAKKEKKKK